MVQDVLGSVAVAQFMRYFSGPKSLADQVASRQESRPGWGTDSDDFLLGFGFLMFLEKVFFTAEYLYLLFKMFIDVNM